MRRSRSSASAGNTDLLPGVSGRALFEDVGIVASPVMAKVPKGSDKGGSVDAKNVSGVRVSEGEYSPDYVDIKRSISGLSSAGGVENRGNYQHEVRRAEKGKKNAVTSDSPAALTVRDHDTFGTVVTPDAPLAEAGGTLYIVDRRSSVLVAEAAPGNSLDEVLSGKAPASSRTYYSNEPIAEVNRLGEDRYRRPIKMDALQKAGAHAAVRPGPSGDRISPPEVKEFDSAYVEGREDDRTRDVNAIVFDMTDAKSEAKREESGHDYGREIVAAGSGTQAALGDAVAFNSELKKSGLSTISGVDMDGDVEGITLEANEPPRSIVIESRFVEVLQTDLDSLGFELLVSDDVELSDISGPARPASAREGIAKEATEITTSIDGTINASYVPMTGVLPRGGSSENRIKESGDKAAELVDVYEEMDRDLEKGEDGGAIIEKWGISSSDENVQDEDEKKIQKRNLPESDKSVELTEGGGRELLKSLEAQTAELMVADPAPVPPPVFNPFVDAAVNAFSTFGIDVDTAAYTITRNALRSGGLPEPGLVRTEEVVNFFDYDDRAPDLDTFAIHIEGTPTPFGHGLRMLRIGVKGKRLGREEQRPAVLTVLVDTSGSMARPDRLGLVQKSLGMLLDELGPRDSVALVQFDSEARVVLEHTGADDRARVVEALRVLQCSGSTNLEKGMKRAYSLAASGFVPGAENRVLLLSDGVANLGSDAAEEILAQVSSFRKQGITCSVFGVGAGNYNDAMLEKLANSGDGSYSYIDSLDEARRVFVDDLAATLNTIASDVKIQVEFNADAVSQYRQLGYENRQLTKEQFRDDTVDAGEVGSGQSVTALYELELEGGPDLKLVVVRVRYRRLSDGKIYETERPITRSMITSSFDDAGTHMKLAVCAAEFAEILRGSPNAAGSRMADVAEKLRPVALNLHLDSRVAELMELVERAGRLGK